ncbi:MAG: DNA polymerase IV [Eubacteriales bacterium]|nr:DNA polymerase IV [Eubacteriales bacterium]
MDFENTRIIFHCDCNNFFASCECLEHPELKNVPMAVAGDPQNRTGIVVAKNDLAKKCGVQTTDTVYAARRKCPGIVFVRPRHHFYAEISRKVNSIFMEYTEYVEKASIDESYLDVTDSLSYFKKTAPELADALRCRIREEIGITISIGVSFNKIFAKLGSDYKKPDAVTVITPDNYKEILWPLPVNDMLFVGKSASTLLKKNNILTIRDLACTDKKFLNQLLGKSGEMLWSYANGLDEEPVRRFDEKPEVKSVSHGMTFKRNLMTADEVRTGLAVLADEVAVSLRKNHMKGCVISVHIKSPALVTISRQTKLDHYTHLQREILDIAVELVQINWKIGASPIRALTIGVTGLVPEEEAPEQLSLFDLGLDNDKKRQKSKLDRQRQEKLEDAMEKIRQKHGSGAISMGYHVNEDIGVHK